jgi:hypothetical protein
MKRMIFLGVIILLICMCVALFWGYQFVLMRAFTGDADIGWIDDCLEDFIARENRFPINWKELKEDNLYSSVPGIEDRVVLNFSVFSILNRNKWQIEMIDDKDQWVYHFQYAKKTTKQQDRLKKYCERLSEGFEKPWYFQYDKRFKKKE